MLYYEIDEVEWQFAWDTRLASLASIEASIHRELADYAENGLTQGNRPWPPPPRSWR